MTHKIEGFFDACVASKPGLTGEQGVVLPATNVANLMLRDDVIAAVAEGKFHIWSVTTIDEGIELLTGIPAGERGADGQYPEDTVNGKVDRKLFLLADRLNKFGQKQENGRQSAHGHGEPEGSPEEPPLPGDQPEPSGPEPDLPGDRPESPEERPEPPGN